MDRFYQDLNARDYQAAWRLGGGNLSGGAGYTSWAASYTTTVGVSASTVQNSDDIVSASITATQTDGTVKAYACTQARESYAKAKAVTRMRSQMKWWSCLRTMNPEPSKADHVG